MGFFDAMSIAASGMSAERTSMDVTAENLANAQSTNGPGGQPYQRQEVVLQQVGSNGFQNALAGAMGTSTSTTPGGVEVAGIVADPTPDQLVYDPGNPDANKQGYVKMPNISPVTEMVNLIDESNSYQTDVTAMQTAKDMFSSTLDVLK
jgi:flagellar basal-body rod protein FlgC